MSIQLDSFRSLKRLPGATTPAIYQINCYCNICEDVHAHLTTGFALDIAPVSTLPPVAHSLQTGKMDWAVELAYSLEKALMKGMWPLSGYCHDCCVIRPLWPTLLRSIQPHGRSSLVSYCCAICDTVQVDEIASDKLYYPYPSS